MNVIGHWLGEANHIKFSSSQIAEFIKEIRKPLYIVFDPQRKALGLTDKGTISHASTASFPLTAVLPPLYPEWLGDRSFLETHGVRFCYIGGAMARGIASVDLVIALSKIGALAFFGSAGLSPEAAEKEILKIKQYLDPLNRPFGANLIHTPQQPELEEKIVGLYLKHDVRRVSAAAFMKLSKAVVWHAGKGLKQGRHEEIIRRNYIFAKISHPSVAKLFMSPPPQEILDQLVKEKKLTLNEAELARRIPIAEDITVEGDSGGHTDNRLLLSLFPRIKSLRDDLSRKFDYPRPIRLGAAGGLGTPEAVAAAFALGASHALLGSVHQAAVESGLSMTGKRLLAQADIDDVIMAPSADMFEMGVKVQVLRKGSMMGIRGNQLYELYRSHNSIEEIPSRILKELEKNIFKMPIDRIWEETVNYFQRAEPLEIEKTDNNPKRKMALIFRWYLGNSSRWPLDGRDDRMTDFQIWCGPAMGAFNSWVRGSFLEKVENRRIDQIALNLLEGAAVITRAHQLRTYGVAVPNYAFDYRPKFLSID